ncbi:hypothetical protein CYLTODRAFT_226185 [Cylindrobasidium torrendii FP15055 ss-10]|uniref:F-box domain-containing protein n=1 Tax=Cylindrobasidium torrendii FP15055 ss-10 TaxID=1314674 RepID=A0A0D7BH69_9AGAR|nr:hypothetical protein CYLTODRAFT_226185 [Cylindrobasidium torrendii FP15055 ss-10]
MDGSWDTVLRQPPALPEPSNEPLSPQLEAEIRPYIKSLQAQRKILKQRSAIYDLSGGMWQCEVERDCDTNAQLVLIENLMKKYKTVLSSSARRRIPPELWAEIFLYCNNREVTSFTYDSSPLVLCRVCSVWRWIVQHDHRLWQTLNFKNTQRAWRVGLSHLTAGAITPKAVHFTFKNSHGDALQNDPQVSAFIENSAPHWKTFGLHSYLTDDTDVRRLLQDGLLSYPMPDVESLVLEIAHFGHPSEGPLKLNMPKLRSLTLQHNQEMQKLHLLLPNIPTLEEFKAHCAILSTDPIFCFFLPMQPQLRRLTLRIVKPGYDQPTVSLPALTFIELHSDLEEHLALFLVRFHLPALRELVFSNHGHLVHFSRMEMLFETLVKMECELERLTFIGFMNMGYTRRMVRQLAKDIPSLKNVSFLSRTGREGSNILALESGG